MRHHGSSGASPYYPPRHNWASPVRQAGWAWRRRLRLDRLHLPPARSVGRTLLCLLVPGLSFYFSGVRWAAKAIFAVVPVAALVFLIWLGRLPSDFAFAVIVAAHVASVSHLIQPWVLGARLAFQLILGVILFGGMNYLLYAPARLWFCTHVALPLRTSQGVVIVNPWADRASVRQGEWVAYRIGESSDYGVIVRAGYGCGPVLATAGERVQFGPRTFRVGETTLPNLRGMPATGTCVVPQNHWFVWPELHIGGNYHPPDVRLDGWLQRLAMVSQDDFVGRPFRHWFFRRQHVP